MVLRTINFNSTVDQWRGQYNFLATDVGDLSLLGTTHDSNLVLAINELIGEYDSASTIVLARGSFSAGTGLLYDSSIGRFSLNTSANDVITFAMMTDSSVGVSELRNNAVTTPKIASGAITTIKFATGAVDSAALGSLSISAGKIQTDAVTSAKIQADAVTSAKIATGAVDSSAIGSLAVSTAKIATDAVTSAKLASLVTLIIYNSAGTALKTLYGAGA